MQCPGECVCDLECGARVSRRASRQGTEFCDAPSPPLAFHKGVRFGSFSTFRKISPATAVFMQEENADGAVDIGSVASMMWAAGGYSLLAATLPLFDSFSSSLPNIPPEVRQRRVLIASSFIFTLGGAREWPADLAPGEDPGKLVAAVLRVHQHLYTTELPSPVTHTLRQASSSDTFLP